MKDIYLGRQAIYDRKGKLFAYELLFRSADTDNAGLKALLDGDGATSEVLLNTFIEIGLERIAGDSRIFINLTRNLIACDHPLVQQKDRVVMELLEDIPVDESLVERVACLSKMGIQLALDDYVFDPIWDPLLPWVHIIKLEIPALSLEQIQTGLPKLRQHNLKLVAEKVETREMYTALHEMGFDYFQGFYFSRPELVGGKRLEENQMVVLRLLAELNRPDTSIREIETLIGQDAALSYKTLRYINSAAVGMPRKIESIGQAVIIMGLRRIRAWASLLVMTGLKNRPQDHYLMALVRAHLCERLVECVNPQDDTGFTVGLLSILDLLLSQPMPEIVRELSLSDQINAALLMGEGISGKALQCARQVEAGEWHLIDFPGVDRDKVYQLYLAASEQAFQEQQSLQET
ncbi:MAG: HDOD domain-containing protein [Candidatus Thiodiazotropha sp. (ex Monitilora ramsayi)]|nr:HDOD domain-containing protein [Candidatus Thiodiazotropha sp. (ex Monitilora ramsayi)]